MEKHIMYVIYGKGGLGGCQLYTLSYLRKEAIRLHLEGSIHTWGEVRKFGWEVRRVEVTIKPI